MAVDDRTCQLRLADRVAGFGLAAALLAELVLWHRLDVDATHLRLRLGDEPRDGLDLMVLEELAAEGTVAEVRPWLDFLARDAVDRVSRRVERRRLIRRDEVRRLGGRVRVSFVPFDNNAVAWRGVRLAQLLVTPPQAGQIHPADVVSVGLVAATGLSRAVWPLPEYRAAGDSRIAELVGQLPESLQHLIHHAEAAVGDAVLAPH